jgi:uncharacterized protein YodC (DUF2158 family)
MSSTAQEFVVGEKVRVKDTGRVMIVEEVYSYVFVYRYRCVWEEEDGMRQHELFRAEQLERVVEHS